MKTQSKIQYNVGEWIKTGAFLTAILGALKYFGYFNQEWYWVISPIIAVYAGILICAFGCLLFTGCLYVKVCIMKKLNK